jgi:hypothetical protein
MNGDNPGLRQTGRSTRIIDQLIQDLFVKGEITVNDHMPEQIESYNNLRIIRNRMETEHVGVKYLINGLTIQLINYEQKNICIQ